MPGAFDDVVHQQIDVGEDGHIDVLQHIVGAVAFGFHGIGGDDQPVAEGVDVTHFATMTKWDTMSFSCCSIAERDFEFDMERRYKKIIGKEAFREKKRNGNSKTRTHDPRSDIIQQKMPQILRRFP